LPAQTPSPVYDAITRSAHPTRPDIWVDSQSPPRHNKWKAYRQRINGVLHNHHLYCDLLGSGVHGKMQIALLPARPSVCRCLTIFFLRDTLTTRVELRPVQLWPDIFKPVLARTLERIKRPVCWLALVATRDCRPANARLRRLTVEFANTCADSLGRCDMPRLEQGLCQSPISANPISAPSARSDNIPTVVQERSRRRTPSGTMETAFPTSPSYPSSVRSH
jgi:hypothetical protein